MASGGGGPTFSTDANDLPTGGSENELRHGAGQSLGVADACHLADEGGGDVGVDYTGEYRVDWTNSIEEGVENPIIHSTFGYAAQLVIADPETGKVEKVIAAHDVGKAIDPVLCEGQIEDRCIWDSVTR